VCAFSRAPVSFQPYITPQTVSRRLCTTTICKATQSKSFPDLPNIFEIEGAFENMSSAAQQGEKRKADDAPGTSAAAVKKPVPLAVNPKRVRELKGGAVTGTGPVIYWMSRDQRVRDNWALLYACQQASKNGAPVAVAFNLVTEYYNAGARQFAFMVKGLQVLAPKLEALGIPFFLLQGNPEETIPKLVKDCNASLLVTDYGPLRLGRQWRDTVANTVDCPFHEVDAHNVVPVWEASDKREYAARTIRPKIHNKLPQFMREFPDVPQQDLKKWPGSAPTPEKINWEAISSEIAARGAAVPEVSWIKPGEDAAMEALSGPQGFLTKARLAKYSDKRNDPSIPDALSGLSPYLHFGQLSPQRAALEAAKHKAVHKASVDGFLEELVIRRELADNYCHYVPNYDSLDAAYDWARDTLQAHAGDKREFLYTREQFEAGKTHDKLWNAAQLEMVATGKMHGYIRMYWAKKILEWTASPQEALEVSIYLNDKWELDGRDPNGYVGCMWSVAGIHDQGWGERAVFGKIRYMNFAGCKRKFDVEKYCARISAVYSKYKAEQKKA
jgi:deoxyribodipyrimidine photo-lyase